MNKRSAQNNESSNPVRPIISTSVEMPHVVEMQKEDEEEEESREDEDVQLVFCRKPPEGPTESEKREHEVTHMPFRSWCPACVQARAADWPHKVQVDKEHRYPEIHLDYCFLREAPGMRSAVILVGKERQAKMMLSHMVPYKGAGTEWVTALLGRGLRNFVIADSSTIVLKSDQEPAL